MRSGSRVELSLTRSDRRKQSREVRRIDIFPKRGYVLDEPMTDFC